MFYRKSRFIRNLQGFIILGTRVNQVMLFFLVYLRGSDILSVPGCCFLSHNWGMWNSYVGSETKCQIFFILQVLLPMLKVITSINPPLIPEDPNELIIICTLPYLPQENTEKWLHMSMALSLCIIMVGNRHSCFGSRK